MDKKVIAQNRRARHEYFVEQTYEAGISLNGGEVKSLRMGNVTFGDSFCLISNGQVFLKNAYIKPYDKIDGFNVKADSTRDRKLLLKKQEIRALKAKVEQKGYSLIPLQFYFKQALIKVELGLCKGKHTYDKKQSLIEKQQKREQDREMSSMLKGER